MTSHFHLHFRSALVLCCAVLSAMMVFGSNRPALAAPGIGGSACIDNTDCVAPGSNLICNYESGADYRTCQALSISVGAPTVTASSVATTVRQNGNGNLQVYGCLGIQSDCSAQPLSNTAFWRSLGTTTGVNSTFTATMNGLRPSRTYTVTIAGSESGVTDYAQVAAATTWPGFGFTPTDANAGCDGATGLCRRDISWTTPFAGDGTIIYGSNPPSWTTGTLTIPASDRLWSLSTTSDGQAWAGTQFGSIFHLQNGSWTQQTNPDQPAGNRLLKASDAFSATDAWFVGYQGLTLRTSNSGASWQIIPLPGNSTTNLAAVHATTQNTAWAAGDNSTIYYFDGTSWAQKYSGGSGSLYDITSVDNQRIWAVGSGNRIITSTDGGANWSTQVLSGAPTDNIGSITTLDGKNFWAAGSSGKIWRFTTSNPTWTPVSNSSTQTITSLVQLSSDELWFTDGVSIGHTVNASAGTPIFTYSSIGAAINVISSARASRVLAMSNQEQFIYQQLGASWSLLTPATTNHLLQLNDLTPNRQYFYVAESSSGGIGAGGFGSFTTPVLDTIRPTVTITPPAPVTNNCSVVITGTAADTSPGTVQSVRVIVDSNPPIAATGTTSWSVTLPCSQVTVGGHTITAYSNDGTNDSLPATATLVYDSTAPTVTITAPSPVNTSTVAVSGTANDGQDQVARIELLVNGTGGRINVPITPGASVNWNMGSVALNPGVNTIVVFATDRAGNEGSASTNVTYNVPTFTLAPEPPSAQTVPAGTSALFNIRATAVNGYTGTVNFSATTSPSGLTPVFSPTQSVSLATQTNGTVTMIVPSAAGNGSGPYTITVTGTDGTVTKTTQVTLTLTTTPDFTLSVNPASRTVVAGNPAVYDLVTSGSSTYALPSGGITWTTSALPSGVTASFSTMTGTPSAGGTGTVKLTLNPSVVVSAGTSITITATDGSVTHTVTVGLEATPPPDFSLIIAPASATTVAGSGNPGAYNVTVTSLNGFGGTVHLSLGSTPSDPAIRPTFSQNDFTPSTAGDVVTLNVTADNTIQCAPVPPPPAAPTPCDYNLTITGTASAVPAPITKTASATLSVIPDTTPPVISGPSASASDHDVTITWTTNEPANSRFDLYADAARTQVVGFMEVTSTYCLANCHVLTYDQILPPQTTFYYTITSRDQAYPTGNSSTISADANGPLTFRTQAAPDNTAPVVTINSPAAGTTVRGVVTISGSATDDNPMSQITISLAGPSGSSNLPNTNITCSSGNTCNFSLSWNTMGGTSPNGNYALTVTALSSTGPAFSATAVRTFTVDNDTTPPTIECLPGQTVCGPIATVNLPCSGNSCTAVITWRTNEDSTSEVEYGLAVDCAQQVQRPDGTYVSCAYTDAKRYDDVNDNPSGSLPNYIDHRVTLTNLAADSLYHYRITSCNISNLCTN